jgi:hypothetical protein
MRITAFDPNQTLKKTTMEGLGVNALLVGLSGMLEPTRLMTTIRVAMCPMNDAAFGVPLIHTVERNGVARL